MQTFTKSIKWRKRPQLWVRFLPMLLLFISTAAWAQPTFVEGTWVNGGPYDANIGTLTDRGTTRFFRAVSNNTNTNSTVLFNNPADNYTPKWAATSNGIYPPNILHTNGAIDGGSFDLNFSTTATRTYTLVIGENAGGNNNVSILETTYTPKDIVSVTDNQLGAVGLSQSVIVTATLDSPLAANEYTILRYSTNGFATSTFVEMTGAGAILTATIPSQSAGTTVEYYVFTSVTNSVGAGAGQLSNSTADYLSLNIANQSGQNTPGANWSYTVQNAVTSAGTGNWATGGTWVGGLAPTATANAIIRSGHNVTLAAAATIASLRVVTGGTYTGSTNTLTIRRGTSDGCGTGVVTLTNNGTFNAGTGTILFDNTGAVSPVHQVSGTITFNNVTIINTNTPQATGVNFGTGSTVNGTLTIRQGGYVCTNAPTYATGSTLLYDQSTGLGGTYTVGSEWTPNATSGQGVPYNVSTGRSGGSGTWTVSFSNFVQYRLCRGSLNIQANSRLTLSTASGGDVKIGGSYSRAGTLTHNNRAIFFIGGFVQNINQTLAGSNPQPFVVIDKTAGEVRPNGVDLQFDAPSGSGNSLSFLTATSRFNLNGRSITLGATVSCVAGSGFKAGITTVGGSGTLVIDNTTGSTADLGTIRMVTSYVVNDSSRLSAITVNRPSVGGAVTFGTNFDSDNINFTAGAVTFTSGSTVRTRTTVNMNSGSVAVNGATWICSGISSGGSNNTAVSLGTGGLWQISGSVSTAWTGTFTPNTGTVEYNGNTTQGVRVFPSYYNLFLSTGAGTVEFNPRTNGSAGVASSVSNEFRMPSGKTFDIYYHALTLSSGCITTGVTGGTLNVGAGSGINRSNALTAVSAATAGFPAMAATTGGGAFLVFGNWPNNGTTGLGLTISNQTPATNSQIYVSGDIAVAGTFACNARGTLVIDGNWSSPHTVNSFPLTTMYRGNAVQTIKRGVGSYNRVVLKGADKNLLVNQTYTFLDSLTLMGSTNLVFPSNTSPQITQLTLSGFATGTGKITPDPTGRLTIGGSGVSNLAWYSASPHYSNAPILGFNAGTLGWLDITRNSTMCVLALTTDLTVGRYNFSGGNGFIRLTNGSDFNIVGTTYAGFASNPTGAGVLSGNGTADSQRFIQLDAGSRVNFTPHTNVLIGTNMSFPVGFSTKASPAYPIILGSTTFTLGAGGGSLIANTAASATSDVQIGDLFLSNTGVPIGLVSAVSATQITLLNRVDPGTPSYTAATFKISRTYRPVILAPQTTDVLGGSQTISVGFENHSGGVVTNGTNIAASPSTRRSNWLAYASSTSASQEFSLSLQGNISNDFNQTMIPTSVALFRSTGSSIWEKYRVDAGFGTTGAGALTSTFFNRNNIGTLDSDNLFAMGQTGGDLPDDPTFTWQGTTSSWTTSANWNISGSLDPYPNSTAHFVVIGSGGTASPILPVATTNVATISQNAKTLTVPGGGTLNVAGQYALNFPTSLLQGGTGTITTVGTVVTGTGTLFTTQLVPGTYLYRASDNLFMGIVLNITNDGTLNLMNFGQSVGGMENFTSATAFNFITRPSNPITGTISIDIGIDSRLLTVSGGTFNSTMLGRAILDGSNNLIGTVGAVLNSTSILLAASATATYTGAGSIMDGIPTTGSGSLVCDDNSTVIYGSNISQMFAPANYYNVSFVDGRSLAATAATIWRVSFATAQTMTIRGKLTSRYWVMHTPITGLTYQLLNNSSMDITVPGYSGGNPGSGQLWRAYSASSSHPNVRFGTASSDRINVRFEYNRNQDLTFQGPEFSIFSNGRLGDLTYIRNSTNTFIVNSGNTIIVNGNAIFTNNAIGGFMLRLGNAAYTPGNECNVTFGGSITYNGTQSAGQDMLNNFAGSLHNFTLTGPGALTFPPNRDLFSGIYTALGTTPSMSNLTYNKPGVTFTLPSTASKHIVCANVITVSGGSIVAPGSPHNGNISGLAMVVNGTGNITSNGANFIGAGAGGVVVTGNGSVTVVGPGNFGTVAAPGDVNISGNAVINLAAGTELVNGHGSSQDWIQTGGTVTMPTGASPFQVARDLQILGGTITKASGNITLGAGLFPGGNLVYNGGTANFSGATLVFNGTANNQSYISSANKTLTVNNLNVNKAGGNVEFQSGKVRLTGVMTIVSNTTITANTGNLVFGSSISGTASLAAVPAGASLSGSNFIMERYITGTASKWSFIGTPITGASLSQLTDDWATTGIGGATQATVVEVNPQRATIFTHEEPLGGIPVDTVQRRGWRAINSNTISVGKGYRNYFRDNSIVTGRIWDMTGGMTFGSQNIPLTRTSFSCTGFPSVQCSTSDQGWNLIANPFPSAIDWSLGAGAFSKPVNMNDAVYTWQNNSYKVWGPFLPGPDPIGFTFGASASSVIPSSQGFFVKLVSGAGGTLVINESAKTSGAGTFFRTAVSSDNRLFIGVTGADGQVDKTWVRFMPEATPEFDLHIDADKLPNPGLNISTLTAMSSMYVNTLPMFDATTLVPIQVTGAPGNYTLHFHDVQSFVPGTEMYLKDNFLGTLTALTEGTTYDFAIESEPASSGSERFELVFTPDAVSGVSVSKGLFSTLVVPNPGNGRNLNLVLRNTTSDQTQVLITDMLGKTLMNRRFETTGTSLVLDTDLPVGVYQMQVINGGKTSIQKIVVNR